MVFENEMDFLCLCTMIFFWNMIVFKGELLIFRQNLHNLTKNDIKFKLAFLLALGIYTLT